MQFLFTKNLIVDDDAVFVFDFSEIKKGFEHVTAFEVKGDDVIMYLDNYLSRKPNADELPLIDDILEQYKELKENTALDRAKAFKLHELAQKAQSFEDNVNKQMYFISSVYIEHEVTTQGDNEEDIKTELVKEFIKVNGDRRTRSNITDLITYQPTDNVLYRDYDNVERVLTKDQLKVMLKEHVVNGQMLYEQKWGLEKQINACTTIEELEQIKIDFVMQDFSQTDTDNEA